MAAGSAPRIGIGTALIAGTVAASAYGNQHASVVLGLIAGALVTAGPLLITLEHHRVKRVERRWLTEHRPSDQGHSLSP